MKNTGDNAYFDLVEPFALRVHLLQISTLQQVIDKKKS